MDRKELIETNPILSLGKEIFDRTDGMCEIGPGPGGIGVTVPQGSKISLLLLFEPYPVYDAGILPDGKSEIGWRQDQNRISLEWSLEDADPRESV